MAFYTVRSESPLSPAEVISHPVAFKVWVMKSAVTSGRWKVIGHVPLETELEESPFFFRRDAISGELSIYREGVERPASREECEGLECAAVWSAEHVESRMEDLFEGRPNQWVESIKL